MINLLPPKTKESLRYARLNLTVVEYGALILVTALGLIGILFFGQSLASREEGLLTSLASDKRASLADYNEGLSRAKELDTQIDTIAALLEREITFSKLLPAIGAVVPPGTTINGLELDSEDGNTLMINGESSNQAGPSIFRQNLADTDKLFSRADIVNINLVDNEGRPDTYSFQINAQFAVGAKQELNR